MSGYKQMLIDVGVSQEQMQQITDIDNVIEFDSDIYHRSTSKIHGVGIFASEYINQGSIIGLGTIDKKYRTILSRWVNHSDDCNAKFYYTKAGDLIMLAIKNIDANEEILVNYREHSLEKAYYV